MLKLLNACDFGQGQGMVLISGNRILCIFLAVCISVTRRGKQENSRPMNSVADYYTP